MLLEVIPNAPSRPYDGLGSLADLRVRATGLPLSAKSRCQRRLLTGSILTLLCFSDGSHTTGQSRIGPLSQSTLSSWWPACLLVFRSRIGMKTNKSPDIPRTTAIVQSPISMLSSALRTRLVYINDEEPVALSLSVQTGSVFDAIQRVLLFGDACVYAVVISCRAVIKNLLG